jgi:hypothetical protein
MALLDDLTAAQNEIAQRIAGRQPHLITRDRAGIAGQEEDQRRLSLLDVLRSLYEGGATQKGIDQAADANYTASIDQLQRNAKGAQGQVLAGAARTGTVGGSRALAAKGRVIADATKATQDAAAATEDWKKSATGTQEDSLRTTLNQILAPSQSMTAVQGAATDGGRDLGRLQTTLDQNESSNRGILANTLAGIVNNGITPGISAGFQQADRRNQQDFNRWQEGGSKGSFTGGKNTWRLW